MRRLFLHPLPLRLWHWANAAVVIALLATGLYLRIYGIANLRPHNPVLAWHRWIGLAAVVLTVFWFGYTIAKGNFRSRYGAGRKDAKRLLAQARYYAFSIFRGEADPFKPTAGVPYNPLQRVVYASVMVLLLPLQAFTGLLFYDIPFVRDRMLAWGLFGPIGALHVLGAYLTVQYLVVHLYMATLGERFFSHTQAMMTGYVEERESSDGATSERIDAASGGRKAEAEPEQHGMNGEIER